jgi:hypothetical protein
MGLQLLLVGLQVQILVAVVEAVVVAQQVALEALALSSFATQAHLLMLQA